jgi:hypothetical protein
MRRMSSSGSVVARKKSEHALSGAGSYVQGVFMESVEIRKEHVDRV